MEQPTSMRIAAILYHRGACLPAVIEGGQARGVVPSNGRNLPPPNRPQTLSLLQLLVCLLGFKGEFVTVAWSNCNNKLEAFSIPELSRQKRGIPLVTE